MNVHTEIIAPTIIGTSPLSGVTIVITPNSVSIPTIMASMPMIRHIILMPLLFLIVDVFVFFCFISTLLFVVVVERHYNRKRRIIK